MTKSCLDYYARAPCRDIGYNPAVYLREHLCVGGGRAMDIPTKPDPRFPTGLRGSGRYREGKPFRGVSPGWEEQKRRVVDPEGATAFMMLGRQ